METRSFLGDSPRLQAGHRRALAGAADRRRVEVSRFFVEASPGAGDGDGPDEAVEFLIAYLRTGDAAFRQLFLGERLKAWPPPSADPDGEAARRAVEAEVRGLVDRLGAGLDARDAGLLGRELQHLVRVAARPCDRTMDVLFFADCLSRDIRRFLVPLVREDGLAIAPTLLFTKDPASQRNALREMAGRTFDLIFYSPFTYGFSPGFAALSGWRRAGASRKAIRRVVDEALAETAATLDLLSGLFGCPVVVHNTANVRRHDGRPREVAKNLLTGPTRRRARALVNAGLADDLQRRRAAGVENLFLLDEGRLLRDRGDHELGRMLHDSGRDEPVFAIGRWLAEEYRDWLAVAARLSGRKLVACDLDNTLWAGAIGEGPVEHFADRQRILRRLREKGVLLAVVSKNDARNVRWEGGVLDDGDFACSQVNWDPKADNLARIERLLNLKAKDFVFVDDRADERELVGSALPQVHVLDATEDRTWRLLDLWSRMIPRPVDEADRTRLYRERAARQALLEEQAEAREDPGRAFAALEIRVAVREAAGDDLARVVELINRSNQFNVCGSRTTAREVADWHAATDRRILLADAADKFGAMGTVCVAVVHILGDRVEVPVFVLSCRVFGYGIEAAVLNAVKRLAARSGAGAPLPVVGLARETPHNGPSRDAYPNLGFRRDGASWIFEGGAAVDPDWLGLRFGDPILAPREASPMA